MLPVTRERSDVQYTVNVKPTYVETKGEMELSSPLATTDQALHFNAQQNNGRMDTASSSGHQRAATTRRCAQPVPPGDCVRY